MAVISVVVGAVTHESATVVAHVDSDADVRVAVDTDPGMTSPTWHGPVTPSAEGIARVKINGLEPATRHHFLVEHDGVLDTQFPGTVRTLPVPGSAASWTLGVSGDAGLRPDTPGVGDVLAPDRLSNHDIFATLASRAVAEDWALFAHLGDLHYYDLGSDQHGITGGASLSNYRRAYSDVLAQPNQHLLYRSTSWLSVWDDHDYGPNDSDGTHPGKEAAAQAYRERVPHYPLADTGGIWQAVQIGRVLVVVSDTRYYRDPNDNPDDGTKTMLGQDQKDWLRGLLITTTARALVWLMPSQWLRSSGSDTWAAFATERAALVDMLTELGWAHRTVMVSADRHAVRVHPPGHPYGGWPVMQASPLDADGGDPLYDYPDGLPDDPGDSHSQYGTLEVADFGDQIWLTISGWRGTSELLGTWTHVIQTPTPIDRLSADVLRRTIGGSHVLRAEARVVTEPQTGPDPDGADLPILAGEVELDGTADVRGTLSMQTEGRLWPTRPTDLLAPVGHEIFVRVGIDLGGAGVQWVPLGYYQIRTPEQASAPDGPIELECRDRMAGLVEARLLAPRQFEAGRTVGAVIRELVGEVYPHAVVEFDDDTEFATLARPVTVEEDRYAFLRELADSSGKLMHWDGEGVLRIESPPDPSQPVWTVGVGSGGVQIAVSRTITRDGVYNGVVARGEGADESEPVQAVAVDLDPTSPTYWHGRYGKVPRFYSSPFIATVAQAANAAREMLKRQLGFPYSVEFTSVPNPALKPFDPIRVILKDNTREVHVMQTVTIPLVADGVQAGTTREQTRVLIGAPS